MEIVCEKHENSVGFRPVGSILEVERPLLGGRNMCVRKNFGHTHNVANHAPYYALICATIINFYYEA